MNLHISSRTLRLVGGIIAGVVLVVAVVVWWGRPGHPAGRVDRSLFENDMMEGFVRCLLRESNIRDAPVCFLAFGEGRTSPSSGFLARFADCRHPAVRGVGSSVLPPVNRLFEKDSGRPGIVLQVIKCEQYIVGVFDITMSFSNLPRGHDRIIYRVARDSGDWTIQKRTPA